MWIKFLKNELLTVPFEENQHFQLHQDVVNNQEQHQEVAGYPYFLEQFQQELE